MTSPALRLHRPSPRELIERIVHEPQLAASVQALTPRSLGKLIQHIGVEDSGELIALATTEQIEKIFDDDLWTVDRPGEEEQFDVDRFVIWLQVMLEVGERFTAEKLEELPEDLVVLALQRSILVVNVDELQITIGDDEESNRTEKALESSLYEEFDEHMVVARRHDGWDAILTVLLALDAHNPALRRRLLERCCALSEEYIEDNGSLYDVLTSEQMLEADLAGERDDRRSSEGFVAPAAAASFLNLARLHDPETAATMERDPITQMYMRSQRRTTQSPSTKNEANANITAARTLETLIEKLSGEPNQTRDGPRLLLGGNSSDHVQHGNTLFRRTLENIAERDPNAHGHRLDEIAFLCNVLISGCSISDRAFRPYEAVMATAATCNLGLEWLAETSGTTDDMPRVSAILQKDGADGAFRLGFSILHHRVARKTLTAILDRVRGPDAVHRLGEIEAFKICEAAAAARDINRPWQFRSTLWDLHELFDGATIEHLNSLLGEFPLIASHSSHRIHNPYQDAWGSSFISTKKEVQDIARFLANI